MKATVLKNAVWSGVLVMLSTASLLSPDEAAAQSAKGSYFRVTPYLWMLSLDGTTAALGQDQDVDASFSDLLDNLNLALSANLEWHTKSGWFFQLDPMWASLESDFASPGPLPVTGKVEIDMLLVDGLVGYSLTDNIGIYGGARFYDQDIDIGFDLGSNPSQSLGDDWTDFILGVKVFGQLTEKWSMSGKLDGAVGGDSDSAFYLQFVFNRQFGESMHLNLGWRYYDVDYVSGSGLTLFKWDVAHSGPIVSWTWMF